MEANNHHNIPDNSLEIEKDSSSNITTGSISEEELYVVENQEKVDEACEYLAIAIHHMSKVGQDDDHMNVVSKGMNAKQENNSSVLCNTETDSENVYDIKMLDSLGKNFVMSDDDTAVPASSKSLKLQDVGTVGMITKSNSEITSSFNRNTCKNADDLYGKLFGRICSAFPVHCTKQSNRMLHTISCDSDLNLSLLLPKELILNVESVFPRKQSRKRTDTRLCQEAFVSNTSDSEPNSVLNDEQLNSEGDELSDSVSENGEHNLDAKIIQTRSGRKTRFTCFSQTLIDDFEGQLFERNGLPNADVNSPSKKIKLELKSDSSSLPKRKRGRPRKVSHENHALNNNTDKGNINVVHSDSTSYSSFKPQETENFNSNFKMSRSLQKDPILSLITDHLKVKTTQEKELVKTMSEHQKEHSSILKEICSIIYELDNKLTKNK